MKKILMAKGARSIVEINLGVKAGENVVIVTEPKQMRIAEALAAAVNNADIVINATIMGMKPHEDVTLIDKSLFRKDLVVADTVYNPEKTKMILEAEEAGCQAIGGKGMLLYQGVVNYSLFTGKDFPIEEYQKFQAEQAK